MADVEPGRRTIKAGTRLSPNEIAERVFATARKGAAQNEVRSFLRRVADDFAALQDRVRVLEGEIDRLETKLTEPIKVDEEQLIDALGTETSRVLRSAQEAAVEIKAKAEERAGRIIHEAQDESQRLRETTEQRVAEQRQRAEHAASEARAAAEARAKELTQQAQQTANELRATAEQEGELAIETARTKGREMVAEARAVRERILTDLTKRRNGLQEQIESLKAGRDRLIEAHKIVQRTLSEASSALSGAEVEAPTATGATEQAAATSAAEAPATAGEPASPTSAPELREEPAAEPEEVEEAPPAPNGSGGTDHGVRSYVRDALGLRGKVEPEPGGESAPSDAGEPAERSAEAIFAKLREEQSTAESEASEEEGAATVEVSVEEGDEEEGGSEPADVFGRRTAALDPIGAELARAAKRQLQDEQNEVLDALRTKRRKPTSEKVLPVEDAAAASWRAVLEEPLTAAYRAGRAEGGAEEGETALPDELLGDLSTHQLSSLRERLAEAIDDETADADEKVERIRARYREWKTAVVSDWVDEELMTAYARGIYDALPDGTTLRWVVDPESTCGPDCEDNALEPTRKGESFPTGQQLPPAFPGCRCVVVAEGIDGDGVSTATESATA